MGPTSLSPCETLARRVTLAAMAPLTHADRRRLREIWRSAGWPCHDPIELDLLERVRQASGHETLRISDADMPLP